MATDPIAFERRCLFCRMRCTTRLFRVPLCAICRDQTYDFFWASGVQGILVAAGLLSGRTFVLEEVLLFVVLVLVKHRIRPPWVTPGGHA